MDENKLELRKNLYRLLEDNNGILRLKPTWVARPDCISGLRLGLGEEETDKGERGQVTERWISSTIKAANIIGPSDEGISYIYTEDGLEFNLKDLFEAGKDLILGDNYSENHSGLSVLVKIFDYADRIFYHYHQTKEDAAIVGRNSKEESYYFPEDADLGLHPETFFGVHPYINDQKKYDIILPYLIEWNSDLILRHSRAYLQVKDDGFHLPAGIPHSPGTALTVEIQEESDVGAVLQALYMGRILSKEKLFSDISPLQREQYGESIVLKQIDWEKSADPYFYENRHTPPIPVSDKKNYGNGREFWIFYNTIKYSGKRLIVYPGKKFDSVEKGTHSVVLWKGIGKIDGHYVEAKKFNYDELLITHHAATKHVIIENTGKDILELFKFFGPDVNTDVPMLPIYKMT